MPDLPDVDAGAKDSAMMAKAKLGVVGRLRLKCSHVVFFVAMMVMPPEMRESAADLTVTDEEE